MRLVRVCAVGAVLTACSATSEPGGTGAKAKVSVDTDVAKISVRNARVELSIPLTISNLGREPLEYVACGAVLERNDGGSWREVWGAICTAGVNARLLIPPGAAIRADVLVDRAFSASQPRDWPNDSLEGEYRVRVLLTRGNDGVVGVPESSSNTFRVAR